MQLDLDPKAVALAHALVRDHAEEFKTILDERGDPARSIGKLAEMVKRDARLEDRGDDLGDIITTIIIIIIIIIIILTS